MQASVMRIDEFISDKRTLVIPVYQRNYDWRKIDCEQLFWDLEVIAENGKDHFIGTFVYEHKPAAGIFQEFVIIDGQQRITSIILFAKALYDLTDDEDLKEDIYSTFLKHGKGERKGKCKLRPTEFDRVTFEKLMNDRGFDENNFDDNEKSSAMYRNYRFFREKISASPLTLRKLHDAIYQLKIVCILLQNENPQEIFESLNSTGLDLSKADLIRNFLLMSLSSYDLQEELYRNYWLEIENLLRPSGNVENFLIQYLITKRKSNDVYTGKKDKLNHRTLYGLFKQHFHDKHIDVKTCLCDLYRYAKFFRRLIFNADTKFANLSALEKKFYELVYLLNAANSPIILMYLLDRNEREPFGEETFIKFVDALISLTFRAKVCGKSGITPQFAGNVLARLDKENHLDTNSFWRAIVESSKVTFPKDKDFQAALVNNSLYTTIKSDGCRYLLYSLERQARSKELPSYSEATVEHIMPQKLNADWKNYLRERNDSSAHEIWLHTLGNLSLTGENSTLSNSDFDSKKEIYRHSNFSYTRALTDYSDWTSKQIQARAKKLAAAAIKIWMLPEEYDSSLVKVGDTLTLDSDFSLLKGTKPAIISISNKEKKINNWIDLLREVMWQLYEQNEDIFRQAAKGENLPRNGKLFSTEPQILNKPLRIDENYYMDSLFSTQECLRTVKVFVENFDRLGETNVKDEIYFTLKRG